MKLRIVCFFLFINCFAQSQTLFNVSPTPSQVGDASVAFSIIPDSISFHVLGVYPDTIFGSTDFTAWPYIATYDLEGNLLEAHTIRDSISKKPHYVTYRMDIGLDNSSHFYKLADRVLDNGEVVEYLFKADIKNGKIILSDTIKPISNEIDYFLTLKMIYRENEITLCNIYELDDQYHLELRLLDTLFQSKETIHYQYSDKIMVPYFLNKADDKFIIIGELFVPGDIDRSLFKLELGLDIDPEMKILELDKNYLFLTVDSYTVVEDDYGNWIIAVSEYNEVDTCFQCRTRIPTVLKVNSDFDSLIWSREFRDFPLEESPKYKYFIKSIVSTVDQSGYISAGGLTHQDQGYAFAFKVSPDGDSLWMRKYLPLGFDEDDIGWIELTDIVSTPYNTYIAAGSFFHKPDTFARSLLLQMDTDGCVIPNCGTTSIEPGPDQKNQALFRIFPNPASDILYLQPTFSSPREHTLSLFNMSGQFMKSVRFTPDKSVQYLVDIQGIPPGQYVVKLSGKTGKDKGSLTFLKQ